MRSVYLQFQEVVHTKSPGHEEHLRRLKERARQVEARVRKFWEDFSQGIPEEAMLYYVEYEGEDSFVGYYYLLDGVVLRKGNHEDSLTDLFVT